MLGAILGGLAVTAAIAGYMWWRRRRDQDEVSLGGYHDVRSGRSDTNRLLDNDDFMESLRRQQEETERREAARAEQAVRDLLGKGDPQVAQLLLELSGNGDKSPQRAAQDDETIRSIAQSVDDHVLQVLGFANRTVEQFENIELEASETREQVHYPAEEFDIEQIRSMSELEAVVPEELAMDDDVFYSLLGNDSLHVIHHYERKRKKRRLYILLDVSGSMGQPMRSGKGKRIQWAAGVALRLMLRAVNGEAEYLLRFFGDSVHELHVVTTPEQADLMARELVRLQDWGEGTDIQGALLVAVNDIIQADEEVETSDILLISDGESPLNAGWLRQTFGDKIRLHVACIETQNPVLANADIASSYQIYA